MFGKKKVKTSFKKHVIHQAGISNFMNDYVMMLVIEESGDCIKFDQNGTTATLPFDKITSVNMGAISDTSSKGSAGAAVLGGALAGTTGAIIGAATGNKSSDLVLLTINYVSSDEEKSISIYPGKQDLGGAGLKLLNILIQRQIIRETPTPTHVDL